MGCNVFLAKVRHVLLADKRHPEKRLVQKLGMYYTIPIHGMRYF